jgi:hypothetical protein
MKYLKLYDNFNSKDFKIKDLLEDISSLDYILSDEDIKVKYYITENNKKGSNMLDKYKTNLENMSNEELADEFAYETGVSIEDVMSDIEDERETYIEELIFKFKQQLGSRGEYSNREPERYMIGTSDDISTKIDDSFENQGVYKIEIFFDIDNKNEEVNKLSDEYYNQLKNHLEEIYDVNVLKEKPYTTGRIKSSGEYGLVSVNCVSVIIENQYYKDKKINESIDDESAIKHYGIYPEDVKDMFYDLEDINTFPEKLRISVDFKSKLGQLGNLRMDDIMSDKKVTFQHFPFIEIRVKSDNINVPNYGLTQEDRNILQRELTKLKEDERFKEVIEVANAHLEDYGWKIEKITKEFLNDYIQIIIEKI